MDQEARLLKVRRAHCAHGWGWLGWLGCTKRTAFAHSPVVLVARPGAPAANDGGRALTAAVRPYARRFGGIPLQQSFDMESKTFRFRFRSAGKPLAPNEFFVPNLQYPNGYGQVSISDYRSRGG